MLGIEMLMKSMGLDPEELKRIGSDMQSAVLDMQRIVQTINLRLTRIETALNIPPMAEAITTKKEDDNG